MIGGRAPAAGAAAGSPRSPMPEPPDAPRPPTWFRQLGDARHLVLWLALAAIPAFSLTALVTDAHRSEYRTHAQEWQARGEAALERGEFAEAAEAFRSALRFAREDRTLRLRLAEALAGADRRPEARAYLLGVWQEQPGNASVNLELARLAAAGGQTDDAVRYYQNAIQGAWEEGAEQRRRETRIELAAYLTARGDARRAEAELMTLAANLPADGPLWRRVGVMFHDVGSYRRALEMYDTALKNDPRDVEALRRAGQASLALGDHAAVVRYLQRVPANAASPEVVLALGTSRQYLAMDPYRRGLSARERATRTRRALERAVARARACPEAPGVGELQPRLAAALRTETVAALARNAERLDAAIALAFETMRTTREGCGPLTALDHALLLLAQQPGETAS
jgi:tetratricopeptide (TPR) repeat protein